MTNTTVKKAFAAAIIICLFSLTFALSASAHPGRTDANGGHYDHSTGEYHYHHGFPAHQHPGGVCPYLNIDATDHSGSGSRAQKQNVSSGNKTTVTKAAETTAETNNETTDNAGDKRSGNVFPTILAVIGLIIFPIVLIKIIIRIKNNHRSASNAAGYDSDSLNLYKGTTNEYTNSDRARQLKSDISELREKCAGFFDKKKTLEDQLGIVSETPKDYLYLKPVPDNENSIPVLQKYRIALVNEKADLQLSVLKMQEKISPGSTVLSKTSEQTDKPAQLKAAPTQNHSKQNDSQPDAEELAERLKKAEQENKKLSREIAALKRSHTAELEAQRKRYLSILTYSEAYNLGYQDARTGTHRTDFPPQNE